MMNDQADQAADITARAQSIEYFHQLPGLDNLAEHFAPRVESIKLWFHHEKLDVSRREIRLVRVLGFVHGYISCQIIHHDFDAVPAVDYRALSYEW
jgi:hypothetical protein